MDYSPAILNEVFLPSHCKYNCRKNDGLERRRVSTVRHGIESLSFLVPKIWDLVPDYIKSSETMDALKTKTKKWIPIECSCRICKLYLLIGFIWIILRPAYISINFAWWDYRVSWVNPMNICIVSIQPVKLKEKVFLVIVSFCLS